MKYIFLLILLLVAYGLFSYGRIFYFAHFSRNPKIQQRDFEIGAGPTLKYIAAGDSTAVGQGASKVENTYPVKVAGDLAKTNHVIYKNIAVSGTTTADLIQKQLDQIISFKPDIVTISISANDATHRVNPDTILQNYKTIIDRITKETQAKLFITDVPNFTGAKLLPFWYIKFLESRSSKLNPRIMTLESDRVKVINIHDFGWDRYPDRSITYSFDHFHPSDTGYENWTNAFLDKIR